MGDIWRVGLDVRSPPPGHGDLCLGDTQTVGHRSQHVPQDSDESTETETRKVRRGAQTGESEEHFFLRKTVIFLKMKILDNLQPWERLAVADALESVSFDKGEDIG